MQTTECLKPRAQKFSLLKSDPWYAKMIAKLRATEIEIITNFITENEALPHEEWEMKLNRMFLWVDNKPKNWTAIMELLMVSGK